MREEKMTIYITSDNERFFSEEAAKKHEERLSNTRAYKVLYEPDLNETGKLGKKGYLIVESLHGHKLWAEDWLYKKLGSRVAFVQGCVPVKNWTFERVDISDIKKSELLAKIVKM